MAKRPLSPGSCPVDVNKFEMIHQVAGIQTGSLDHPQPSGGQSCRVAFVNTGSPLRFTIALDRGGDIVEAFYAQHSLTYLTPNGYAPPSHAYHRDFDWLDSWPGGLVTTCGPQHMGPPLPDEPGTSLHGHHSNTPAAINAIQQPDPRRGRLEMFIDLTIRDSRMFGHVIETRRRITATLGQSVIHIHDEVTNLGNERCRHHQLYHCNPGYPLLNADARLIYRGKLDTTWNSADGPPAMDCSGKTDKRVPQPLAHHSGTGESGCVVAVEPDRKGLCHAGIINDKLSLGLELIWPAKQLPRMANWHHFGPNGSYVTGLEPFAGSLLGPDNDTTPHVKNTLRPGQTRKYDLTLAVHSDAKALAGLAKHDGNVK